MVDFRSTEFVMEEHELKKYLQEYKNGQKPWDIKNHVGLVKSMMHFIGSTDSELRDKLIYTTFFHLAIDNQLDHELLRDLLDHCLSDDMLFKGIGENGTDTVFTRAFSSLVIAVILYKDNKDDFLSRDAVYKTKYHLINYINSENDLRGFVPVKGWAHSIAHVADAFDELILNKKMEQKDLFDMLPPLWGKILVSESVYVHGEDERMITPILAMLEKGLDIVEIEHLLKGIPAELKRRKEHVKEENYWFLEANCKTFLKSFYVKISSREELISLRRGIELCLSEL
ncbi:DUF2785 domain-containing protein [Rossellomorea vietnamensis]|uniref:DUF2785 domain-containing protein n=1 Tax=Rossellomorea vietnamensis TaxID=218284 RepID=A0ACD4C738_9BACI|nr:DUF2785 domain-containing protein [Rossellomorea vietnamensis]UXH44059.1 DUF2785 domain-containing protein [Rossellomorea vietnamensis]WQI95419.1 DUF2785 domain-containing protein [Rossellomorea vietnamensis]